MASLINKFIELQKKCDENPEAFYKETNYFKDLDIPEDQIKAIKNLEANFLDKMHFIFSKEMRMRQDKDYGLSATEIFLRSVLSEEGKDLIRILEEHIPSECMVLYFLDRVYREFDTQITGVMKMCEDCEMQDECEDEDDDM